MVFINNSLVFKVVVLEHPSIVSHFSGTADDRASANCSAPFGIVFPSAFTDDLNINDDHCEKCIRRYLDICVSPIY